MGGLALGTFVDGADVAVFEPWTGFSGDGETTAVADWAVDLAAVGLAFFCDAGFSFERVFDERSAGSRVETEVAFFFGEGGAAGFASSAFFFCGGFARSRSGSVSFLDDANLEVVGFFAGAFLLSVDTGFLAMMGVSIKQRYFRSVDSVFFRI